jgi:hypothetical protein
LASRSAFLRRALGHSITKPDAFHIFLRCLALLAEPGGFLLVLLCHLLQERSTAPATKATVATLDNIRGLAQRAGDLASRAYAGSSSQIEVVVFGARLRPYCAGLRKSAGDALVGVSQNIRCQSSALRATGRAYKIRLRRYQRG